MNPRELTSLTKEILQILPADDEWKLQKSSVIRHGTHGLWATYVGHEDLASTASSASAHASPASVTATSVTASATSKAAAAAAAWWSGTGEAWFGLTIL